MAWKKISQLSSGSLENLSLSGLTAEHVRLGVYKVSFGIDGINCSGKHFYYDLWRNLYLHYQVPLSDVKQKFIPKPLSSEYSIGSNPTDYERYVINYYGVQQNEKVKRGDIRKIVVEFKSINTRTAGATALTTTAGTCYMTVTRVK